MVFGRKQGLEDLIEVGGINSNPGILDRHLHTIVPVQFGSYGQHSRLYRPHRIDGIHNQIQNHLLQLDLIAKHRRNLIVEFRFKINLMFSQIDVDQPQNCPDQFVDIDPDLSCVSFLNIDLTFLMMSLAR